MFSFYKGINDAFYIVLFDEATVKDLSTYESPHQYSTGFKYVLVNGELEVDNEKVNGTRSGKSIQHIQ